jgi:hypothetical protein
LKNSKYYKLIEKLKADIKKKGINAKTNVPDLKELREMVVEENQPLLAKTIRLTFQHIEKNNTFNIAIPDDEPIEGFEKEDVKVEVNPVESLTYLLSNMTDVSNKLNVSDIRDFVAELKEIAGEDY